MATVTQKIEIHPLTQDPTKAWTEMQSDQDLQVLEVEMESLKNDSDSRQDVIRVVCVSDTHNQTSRMDHVIPDGDILIHAGDFSISGLVSEVKEFNNWLGTLSHKHKIVIAGNHDISFDARKAIQQEYSNFADTKGFSVDDMKKFLTNCIYLEDSWIEVLGYKIYGSPWTPINKDDSFRLPRGGPLLEKWNQIPDDTDIIVTHGPPLGYGDLIPGNRRVGCLELLNTIRYRVKPKYHIFGHIHDCHGVQSNGTTTFINAAICDARGNPTNQPIVFDLKKISV